jgi:hypothetical protein
MRLKSLLVSALAMGVLAASAASASAVTVSPGGPIALSGGASTLTASNGGEVRCGSISSPAPPPWAQELRISTAGVPSGSLYLNSCVQYDPTGLPVAPATIGCAVLGGSTTAGPPIRLTFNVNCTVVAGTGCFLTASGGIVFDYDNNGTLRLASESLNIVRQGMSCIGEWRGAADLAIPGSVTLSPTQVVTP